jgi:hypothetical protein
MGPTTTDKILKKKLPSNRGFMGLGLIIHPNSKATRFRANFKIEKYSLRSILLVLFRKSNFLKKYHLMHCFSNKKLEASKTTLF